MINRLHQGDGPRRGRVGLPLIVVAVASGAGFWLGVLRHTTNGNLGLAARTSSLDFGEPWEQPGFPWTLVIDNPTEERVVIESLETTCGCTTPKPNSLTIDAGSSADVRLSIDLSPRRPSEALSPETDFSVGVIPVFRQGEQRLSGKGWTIRGRVHHALRPAERAMALGTAAPLVAGGPRDPITMTATALRPLRGVRALSASPFVSASVSPGPRPDQFLIAVRPTAELPPGPLQCALELRPETDAGELLPALKIKIEGLALAPVAAIPDELDFGIQKLGETATAAIRLESLLRKPFEILTVAIHDKTAAPLTAVEANEDATTLRMRKHFTSAGSFSAEVRVTIRMGDAALFELDIPVRAYVSGSPAEDQPT